MSVTKITQEQIKGRIYKKITLASEAELDTIKTLGLYEYDYTITHGDSTTETFTGFLEVTQKVHSSGVTVYYQMRLENEIVKTRRWRNGNWSDDTPKGWTPWRLDGFTSFDERTGGRGEEFKHRRLYVKQAGVDTKAAAVNFDVRGNMLTRRLGVGNNMSISDNDYALRVKDGMHINQGRARFEEIDGFTVTVLEGRPIRLVDKHSYDAGLNYENGELQLRAYRMVLSTETDKLQQSRNPDGTISPRMSIGNIRTTIVSGVDVKGALIVGNNIYVGRDAVTKRPNNYLDFKGRFALNVRNGGIRSQGDIMLTERLRFNTHMTHSYVSGVGRTYVPRERNTAQIWRNDKPVIVLGSVSTITTEASGNYSLDKYPNEVVSIDGHLVTQGGHEVFPVIRFDMQSLTNTSTEDDILFAFGPRFNSVNQKASLFRLLDQMVMKQVFVQDYPGNNNGNFWDGTYDSTNPKQGQTPLEIQRYAEVISGTTYRVYRFIMRNYSLNSPFVTVEAGQPIGYDKYTVVEILRNMTGNIPSQTLTCRVIES